MPIAREALIPASIPQRSTSAAWPGSRNRVTASRTGEAVAPHKRSNWIRQEPAHVVEEGEQPGHHGQGDGDACRRGGGVTPEPLPQAPGQGHSPLAVRGDGGRQSVAGPGDDQGRRLTQHPPQLSLQDFDALKGRLAPPPTLEREPTPPRPSPAAGSPALASTVLRAPIRVWSPPGLPAGHRSMTPRRRRSWAPAAAFRDDVASHARLALGAHRGRALADAPHRLTQMLPLPPERQRPAGPARQRRDEPPSGSPSPPGPRSGA